MLIFFILFALAQEEFSANLYAEQTINCHFLQEPTPTLTAIDTAAQIKELLPKIKNQYPIQILWLKSESFLVKLTEVLYKNEANCKNQNLTHWGQGEDFPSLGLLHSIWYPESQQKKYEETFPLLIEFIKKQISERAPLIQHSLPVSLLGTPLSEAPWKTKDEFDQVLNLSQRIEKGKFSFSLWLHKVFSPSLYKKAQELLQLRLFLADPVVLQLQTQFAVERATDSLHKILALKSLESPDREHLIYKTIKNLLRTPEGTLSLIDYINFKGDGTNPLEKTPLGNYSWGLKSVLEILPQQQENSPFCTKKITKDIHCSNIQFMQAALCQLNRLSKFSGEDGSPEQALRYKWLNGGWKNRIFETYSPWSFHTPRCISSEDISQ